MTETPPSPVLLLGWDGADWKVMHDLMDRGLMPNLLNLVERGVMGNLASGRPMLSPILWTTIATGQSPDRHGIYGFTEPRPDGQGVRPVSSSSVKAPTLWEICAAEARPSAVVGWFATYPADRFPGIVVSDMYPNMSGTSFADWKMPPRVVSPPDMESPLAEVRVHHADISASHVNAFASGVAEISPQDDERPGVIARYLARASTVHAAATHIAEHEPWDLLAVYFETIDRLSHWFMQARAPKLHWIDQNDVDLYGKVVDMAYHFHDQMLGRYLKLVDEDTTVIICSDHGFHSDHLRPKTSSDMRTGNPILWHRPQGVFVAAGPNIRQDETVFGATISDIAPTVLAQLGIPPSLEMDGRVLEQIFKSPPNLTAVTRQGLALGGQEQQGTSDDPWPGSETLMQLVSLGYIEAPPDDGVTGIVQANVTKAMNLADVFAAQGRFELARDQLEEAMALQPQNPRPRINLAQCCLHLGELETAERLLEPLMADGENRPWVQMVQGEIALRRGNLDLAYERLRRASDSPGTSYTLHNRLGLIHARQKNWKEARDAYQLALDADGENADAHAGLGYALHQLGDNDRAIEHLMTSLGLQYYQPRVHFHLGIALASTGRLNNASESIRNALAMRPTLTPAREALKTLRQHLQGEAGELIDVALNAAVPDDSSPPNKDSPGAAAPIEIVRESKVRSVFDATRDVVIVSGLPRSGTSMMMRMLQAGGMPLLIDEKRQADINNPHGYFELDAVMRIMHDTVWVPEAAGRAVKVVAQLLRHLPTDRRYRVVFMHRDRQTVARSQHTMLEQRQYTPATSFRNKSARRPRIRMETILRTCNRDLVESTQLLAGSDVFDVLHVDYEATLKDARAVAVEVASFLERSLDVAAMAAAVDVNLDRQGARV